MDVIARSRIHAALGDPHRLAVVDALRESDRTFRELTELIDLPGNAAAHHLAVLESAGLVERRVSEGDRRRRYVTLRHEVLADLDPVGRVLPEPVLFVCTHNSARSQFAAALWSLRSLGRAESAGTHPADRVHPAAVRSAADYGLDLSSSRPRGYADVAVEPELVVSVCDRAREADLPFAVPSIHWSIPDPVADGSPDAFRSAFAAIAERIDRLAGNEHGSRRTQ